MNKKRDNSTPDLFSTNALGGISATRSRDVALSRTLRHPALPKNLPEAIKYLNDRDLIRLLYAAIDEVKLRRGLSPALETTLRNYRAAERSTKKTQPPSRHRQVGMTTSLTRGQVNAVRAAFKAGITLSRIARQFGLSQSAVRKALSSDESER
jgi:predicted DNA binding protein